MKNKKTDKQKEQDRKGADRMSAYLERKKAREESAAQPVEEQPGKKLSYYMRKKLEQQQKEAPTAAETPQEEQQTEKLSWYQRKKLEKEKARRQLLDLPEPAPKTQLVSRRPEAKFLTAWQKMGPNGDWKQIFIPIKDA